MSLDPVDPCLGILMLHLMKMEPRPQAADQYIDTHEESTFKVEISPLRKCLTSLSSEYKLKRWRFS